MHILHNLIGLKALSDSNPVSGRFINELPGMSAELITGIKGPDKANLAEAWEAIVTRAKYQFFSDVETIYSAGDGFNKNVFFSGQIEPDFSVPFLTGAGYSGIVIDIRDTDKLDVFIEAIGFYSNTEALQQELLILNVFNGEQFPFKYLTGEAVEAPKVDIIRGLNRVEVGACIQTGLKVDSVFIGFNNPELQLARLKMPTNAVLNSNTSALEFFGAENLVNFAPLSSSMTILENAVIFPYIRVECSIPKLITKYTRDFTQAFMLLLGMEVLREKINSPATNFWSSGNIVITEENLANLTKLYNRELAKLPKKVPAGDFCGGCNDCGFIGYTFDNMP